MLIKVSEFCAWENERWSYVFDLEKQEAEAINYLMIFIRLANQHFEKVKEEAESKPPPIPYHILFNPRPLYVFAASKYSLEFYDSIEQKENSVRLIKSGGGLSMRNGSGYNDFTNIMIDRKISIARMKSAMVSIRGKKKENKLYKRFDNIFLFKKIAHAE